MRKMIFVFVCLLALLPLSALAAQDMTPSVTVADQFVAGNTVTLDEVVSAGLGWVVIHIDNAGSPGPVAGYAQVYDGVNTNVTITIDPTIATPVLFAMLHTDTGTEGVYEFGTVEGADGPVSVDGAVVTPAFNAAIIVTNDQFLVDNTVTIGSVTAAQDGFVVIHSGDAASFGPVLGVTPISAGTTTNVVVEIAAEGRTAYLWPMLHVDTGTVGTYEFGTVEGADSPVVVNGAVATLPVNTVANINATSQVVTSSDNAPAMMEAASVYIASVLSDGPGFVVIHIDNNGAPGPVAGFLAVPAGYSSNLEVPLDAAVALTPVVWPMLHVDTGVVGTYEFGMVEGADSPVRVGDAVVTFPINATAAMTFDAQALGEGGTVTIASAVIDSAGWLVIHADNAGAPGPVLGYAPLNAGLNRNVVVTLTDTAAAGAQVFPMLHYDTGVVGAYEFGTVEGADLPVVVGGNVVVAPLAITQ